MIENKLFQLISSSENGIPLGKVASEIYHVRSTSNTQLHNVVLPAVLNDKRYLVTSDRKIVLSETGRHYRELIDTTFVALDIETTGTNSFNDRITEIGALKIEGGSVAGTYETLINPGRYIPYDITNLTGITNEMVTGSPTIETVIPEFLDFVGDAVLIAHNASFDIRFINSSLRELGMNKLENEVMCTYKLGRKTFPELKRFNLKSLTKHLRILNVSPHRAGSDASACARIFLRILSELPDREIYSLNALRTYA